MEDSQFQSSLQVLIQGGHIDTLIRLLNDPQIRVEASELLGNSEYETVINTAKHVGQEEYIQRVVSYLSRFINS